LWDTLLIVKEKTELCETINYTGNRTYKAIPDTQEISKNMVTTFQQNTLKCHQREKGSWADPLLERMMTKNPFSTEEKLIT
jgi:hypothetical protein